MSISPQFVSLEMRKLAYDKLFSHPNLQLRIWTKEHPLSNQDMAENFMTEWNLFGFGDFVYHSQLGQSVWEKAAKCIQQGAPLSEIQQAVTHVGPWGPYRGTLNVGYLYEWTESDRVVYVGFSRQDDVRRRQRAHKSFRESGAAFRVVGFGSRNSETSLINCRILNRDSLRNSKVEPLRGLDMFSDPGASSLKGILIVGMENKYPLPDSPFKNSAQTFKRSISQLMRHIRCNARLTIGESLVEIVREKAHRIRPGYPPKYVAIETLGEDSIMMGRGDLVEVVCSACKTLGVTTKQSQDREPIQIHVDPVCCEAVGKQ